MISRVSPVIPGTAPSADRSPPARPAMPVPPRFGQQDTFRARDLVVRLLDLVEELKTPDRNVHALAPKNPFKDCDLEAAINLINAFNATVPEAKRFQQDSFNPKAFKATLGGGRTLWLRLYDDNPVDKRYTNVTGPHVFIRLTAQDDSSPKEVRLPLRSGRLLSVREQQSLCLQERRTRINAMADA